MDVAVVVEGHYSGKEAANHIDGEADGVGLREAVELLGVGHGDAVGVGGAALEDVVEHDAVEEFADDVMVGMDVAFGIEGLGGDQAVHHDEVFADNADGGFASGSLDDVGRKAFVEELHCNGLTTACTLVDLYAAHDAPHASNADGGLEDVDFVVYADRAFCGALYGDELGQGGISN